MTQDLKKELKRDILAGITPAKIAKNHNLPPWKVYGYKKTLKDAGVNFPSVKFGHQKNVATPETTNTMSLNGNYSKFLVNGIVVGVKGAKTINISKGADGDTYFQADFV